jgi:hypothetical protein
MVTHCIPLAQTWTSDSGLAAKTIRELYSRRRFRRNKELFG